MPCPLCVLGFKQPHSKDDWKKLDESPELQTKLRKALDDYNTRTFKDGLK